MGRERWAMVMVLDVVILFFWNKDAICEGSKNRICSRFGCCGVSRPCL